MASIDLDRCPPLRCTVAERRGVETLRIGRPPRLSARAWLAWIGRQVAVDVALCIGGALLLALVLAFG